MGVLELEAGGMASLQEQNRCSKIASWGRFFKVMFYILYIIYRTLPFNMLPYAINGREAIKGGYKGRFKG